MKLSFVIDEKKIGDGNDTFLWFNWHPTGPLYQRFSNKIGLNVTRNLNAKADIVIEGVWKWPGKRNKTLRD